MSTSKVTVAELLKGSDNINRMRVEIERVVSMLMSVWPKNASSTLIGDDVTWDIGLDNEVVCRSRGGKHLFSSRQPKKFTAENVQWVYRNLQTLVDWAARDHEVCEQIKHVVYAASVQFPD